MFRLELDAIFYSHPMMRMVQSARPYIAIWNVFVDAIV